MLTTHSGRPALVYLSSVLVHRQLLPLQHECANWHIMSLLDDVTSPTTVAHYVSMTCSEHREALTAAPTADCVHKQAFRVEG